MRKVTTLLLVCLAATANISAQNRTPGENDQEKTNKTHLIDYRQGTAENPTMDAIRVEDGDIQLDGKLDESVWILAPVATGFTQQRPKDGGSPSQRTEAQILYTNSYVYVGIKAYETSIDSIDAPLFRRDGDETSDWVYVAFDSYNDKRTAFAFGVNPRSVQKDILLYDDTEEDELWDAVWEASTNIDGDYWTVEMKIPLSQLRFSSRNNIQSWGVNFMRGIARHNEENYWAPVLQSDPGFVSKFGRLNGIEDLEEPNRLEISPYFSSSLTRVPESDTSDPYYDSNEFKSSIGGDIKYGLTSDLTLTATVNPDFGQVEADPSTINLTAYETYFEERRPFFLEGSDIFYFGNTRTYNSFGNPVTFYSRRIGRAPTGNISMANNYSGGGYFNSDSAQSRYQDIPDQTSIAAAAKISGKTKSGWSIGFLDAYTLKETASYTVDQGGLGETRGKFDAEPVANYLITRVKKDINEGNTVAGGYFGSVLRGTDGTYFEDYMTSSAFITGVDFEHNWKDREWVVSGTFSVSQINGTEQVITNAQNAPQRYMQRVDSDELNVDPTKTSLEGFATELSLRKSSGDHWTGSVTYSEVSPGYETNDIGFQNRADYRALAFAFQYQESKPKKLQYWEMWSNHLYGWNYDGDKLFQNYNLGGFWRFENQWSFNLNLNGSFGRVSDRLTRGGPLMKYNDDINFNFNIRSNQAKKFAGGIGNFHRRDIGNEYDDYYWVWFSYRPTTFIQISFEPELGFELDEDQFVSTIARQPGDPDASQTYGNRYIFADARTVNLVGNIRLNWTFTPKMSLQTYLRPYIASANFSNFGEFNDPGGFGFDRYGKDEGQLYDNGNGNYGVDIDSDGDQDFNFHREDFTYRAIQGNAVFRWEYKPGSTFFLVWQQQRDGVIQDGTHDLGRDIRGLFDPKPVNVFLIKFSYWFGT